jgi:hypothetical protein
MCVKQKSPGAKPQTAVPQQPTKSPPSQRTATPTALPRPQAVLQRAQTDPGQLSAAEVDVLQRTIGLRAAQHMLGIPSPFARPIQAKLMVGPVGDTYEQEADRVAKQVVNTPAPVQRQDKLTDEDDLQMKPLIQRAGAGGFEVDADFESHLSSSKGGGAPLPDRVRADFEPKFGADFSQVRTHTDSQSDQLNRSIQAKAFTTGRDIFFRAGEYNPDSLSGKELLAHELTHTVQQGAAPLQRQPASPAEDSTVNALEQKQHLVYEGLHVVQTKPVLANPGHTIQRAYWEKVGTDYVWHGGEEQPPGNYIKLDEPKRSNPKNKNALYDVFQKPEPKKGKPKKKKTKGGSQPIGKQQPEAVIVHVETPQKKEPVKQQPLKKPQALKAAARAPGLLEEAETQALLAATEMSNAATPELAVASSKKADTAASQAAAKAGELTIILTNVSNFLELVTQVTPHEAAAKAAATAAAKFAAQARRLADVVEAEAKVKEITGKEEAEKLKLQTAEARSEEIRQEIAYLQGYLVAFDIDMPRVAQSSFKPSEDPSGKRLEILAEIAQATEELQENEQAVADLKKSVASLGKEKETAAEDIPLKTLAATTGATGLAETEAELKTTRELRVLAGGELNLVALRTLPKFTSDTITLKSYLEALNGTGLTKPKAIQLITDLSVTHSASELSTIGTAIAGGVDIGVAVALALLTPKLTAETVALFGKVQASAKCTLQIIKDLLPLRDVPLYATEPVLLALAIVAKGGVSASRMVEIVLDQKTLPKDDLVKLTELFDDYTTKEEMIILAKTVKEGMKGGRKAADLVEIIEGLKSAGVAVPTAATIKLVLQAVALEAFDEDDMVRFMTLLNGLTGAQLVEVGTWLSPLPPENILTLIDAFVNDGTPAVNIHATFQAMNKARMDGAAIRDKVGYLRGFLVAFGDERDADITEVGGKKILTGPEIHAHALNALSGPTPHTKVGNLSKYPKGENPGTRHVDDLWRDVNPAPRGTETAEEGVRRQKLALAEICSLNDVFPKIAQQVAAINFGAAPRTIDLPAVEDARDPSGSAHVSTMHTIGGGGNINNYYDLAARACYSPTAKGQASAFKSPADAKAAIQAALTDYIATPGNWEWLRGQLIKGNARAIDQPVGATRGVWLRTNGGGGPNGLYDVNGDDVYVNQAAKPKHSGGKGGRPYFAGDNGPIPNKGGFVMTGTGKTATNVTFGGANVPYEPGNPLTTVVAATGVHLRIIGTNCKGGFAINSAYLY